MELVKMNKQDLKYLLLTIGTLSGVIIGALLITEGIIEKLF